MNRAFPELGRALSEMLSRIDRSIRESGYGGDAIRMYLAGGLAINFYCGSRYTEDVDASFSHRLLLPPDLEIDYTRQDGRPSAIYFDRNYNTTFALLHADHEADAREWEGIGNERRLVKLLVLSPLDLAVSKLARFSPQDREDILNLADARLIDADRLRQRAMEAMADYVGDAGPLKTSLDLIERDVRGRQSG